VKRQRVQFEASLRSVVEGHLKLLETFTESGPEAGIEYLPAKKKTADEK
jgi:cell division initiation protein